MLLHMMKLTVKFMQLGEIKMVKIYCFLGLQIMARKLLVIIKSILLLTHIKTIDSS